MSPPRLLVFTIAAIAILAYGGLVTMLLSVRSPEALVAATPIVTSSPAPGSSD